MEKMWAAALLPIVDGEMFLDPLRAVVLKDIHRLPIPHSKS
jgi:hypothetical protein